LLKLAKVENKLGQLEAQEKMMEQRNLGPRISPRKARTRTLIQAGGLLKLSGLFDICSIKDGDDLQADLTMLDKAATLLGILMETVRTISPNPSQQDLECWQQSGVSVLKQSAASKHYRARR